MTRGQIQAAFDALLATITNGGEIRVQDGSVYVPQEGVPYMVGTLSSYTRTALTIGPNASYQYSGTYTISIMRPAGEGTAQADILAGIVQDVFARGLSLATGTNTSVQIFNSGEQQLMTAADWITLPVVVSWLGTDQIS